MLTKFIYSKCDFDFYFYTSPKPIFLLTIRAFSLNLLPFSRVFFPSFFVFARAKNGKNDWILRRKIAMVWSTNTNELPKNGQKKKIFIYFLLRYTFLTVQVYVDVFSFRPFCFFLLLFYIKKYDGRKSLGIDLVCQWFILNGISKTFCFGFIFYIYLFFFGLVSGELRARSFSVYIFLLVCIYYLELTEEIETLHYAL